MSVRGVALALRTRRGAVVLDLSLALVLTAIVQYEVWSGGEGVGSKAVSGPLFLLATVPLVWRRRAPLAMAAARMVGLVGQAVLTGSSPESAGLTLSALVAGYSVAAYSERRRAILAVALIAIGGIVRELYDPALHTAAQLWAGAFFWLLLAATFVFGTYVRSRRRAASLEDHAARLERERDERARVAVAEERARIARELHDVIAHSVSVVVVQAVAAMGILERQPERAREPLRKIEQSGREALTEMRRLLGILRDDDGQTLAPQPGLGELQALLENVRSAGLPVELEVEGEIEELPRGVDLSAYRIVQEALTNALKHAGPARARVHVRYEPDSVQLEVTDDGAGAAATNGAGGGHGLIGMRERVTLYGGVLEARPRAEGGFLVRARLPLGRESL